MLETFSLKEVYENTIKAYMDRAVSGEMVRFQVQVPDVHGDTTMGGSHLCSLY